MNSKVQTTVDAHLLPYIEKLPEIQKLLSSACPTIETKTLSGEKPAAQNINLFKRSRKVWDTKYADKAIHLPDSKGLQYIAYLLSRRGSKIFVSTLCQDLNTKGASTTENYDHQSKEILLQQGLNIADFGDAGDVIDEKAKDQYRAKWKKLKEQQEVAEGYGHIEEVVEIKEEMETLGKYISKDLGLRGRPRKALDITEKMRKAVSNAIDRAINKIKEEHESLSTHLIKSIKKGKYISYQPEKPTFWDITLQKP
jgi:hypothetical protein